MRHVPFRFLATLVLAWLLTACVPIPGTKLYSSVLCWQRGDARIERTEWEHSMLAVVSAEGLMAKGKYRHFEYWLHEGDAVYMVADRRLVLPGSAERKTTP